MDYESKYIVAGDIYGIMFFVITLSICAYSVISLAILIMDMSLVNGPLTLI